jgi:RNA polymerase sigma-70 factor (sigma-E family)
VVASVSFAAPSPDGSTRPLPRDRCAPMTERDEFEAFFDRHFRDLDRLAYLLTQDASAADDLSADVLLATWKQWHRVRSRDDPFAYVRRMMVNMAATRVRRITRERRRLALFQHEAGDTTTSGPDGAAVLDVRAALLVLPVRRRACVVLRHAFDLSEQEVATILAVSVGTVKSQTSKGVAQLQQLLAVTEESSWLT